MSNVRTVDSNTGYLMLQDIIGDVKSRRNISVPIVIFIQRTKRRWSIMLPRSMRSKFEAVDGLSFCEQDFHFYNFSDKIRERNIELINENLVIQWLT